MYIKKRFTTAGRYNSYKLLHTIKYAKKKKLSIEGINSFTVRVGDFNIALSIIEDWIM